MAMEIIEQLLVGLRLGPPQAHGNLALFPLVAEFDRLPRYLLLDEALEKNVARITEVSAEGRVPELAFENASVEKIRPDPGAATSAAGGRKKSSARTVRSSGRE